MSEDKKSVAEKCMNAAYDGSISFPEIVGTLIENGFESYHVDYLRNSTTYYLADGEGFELTAPQNDTPVAKEFDVLSIQSAIRDAQQKVEGYTYKGFCDKVMAAGCVGYIVSFLGRRVVYFGRTAEMHIEHFPQ